MDLENSQGYDNTLKNWSDCDVPRIRLELKRFIFDKKIMAPEVSEWLEHQLVAP